MKKLIFAMLSICLLTLAACSPPDLLNPEKDKQPPTDPTSASRPAEYTEPSQSETEPSSPESNVPYLVTVKNHDQPIFSAPTYDSTCVDTVREAGVFTVVDEAIDNENNLWGKLKSGKGWIELTDVEHYNAQNLLITAGLMNYVAPAGSLIAVEEAQYSVPVIFHAYEVLTNVRFYSLSWDGESYEPAEPFYVALEMTAKTPVVAYLEFLGDMTMYGVSFQDADGNFHHYRLSQNGRNNNLSFTTYDPNYGT